MAPSESAEGAPVTSLTERVRALYEESVVPVREIAGIAGVSERAIYKYAKKHAWRPRVVRFARAAGGRFIPAADADKPHAHGIKALDPDGAARAAERCVAAGALSDQALADAQARAEAARRTAALMRAEDTLLEALAEIPKILRMAPPGSAAQACARRLGKAIVCGLERIAASRLNPSTCVSAPGSGAGDF